MSEKPFDYRRHDIEFARHHERFKRYVAAHGLICQECGGAGGETEVISWELGGPWMPCGWCEGTGKVTRWLRGRWLQWRRSVRQRKAA